MLTLLFAACAAACHGARVPEVPEPAACADTVVVSCSGTVDRLLGYANKVRVLDTTALSREYRLASAGFKKAPSYINRMKLALLLTQPDSDKHDDERGLELIEGALASGGASTPSETAFARLLYALVTDRVHQTDSGLRVTRQLNAELEDRHSQLRRQLEDAQSRLADEREKRLTLEGQLDALKKLEETINQRESSGGDDGL